MNALAAHNELELELRRLPSVVAVSIGPEAGGLVVDVLVDRPGAIERLRSEVVSRTRRLVSGGLRVRVRPTGPEPAAGRVRLEEVVEASATDQVEVHLRVARRTAVGRAPAGAGARAGAEATLDGLADAGLSVPWRVEACRRLEGELAGSVVVRVASVEQAMTTAPRYGVARAEREVEAAAKATLDALNRWIGTVDLADPSIATLLEEVERAGTGAVEPG